MKLALIWILELLDWIFNKNFIRQATEIAVYSWKSEPWLEW